MSDKNRIDEQRELILNAAEEAFAQKGLLGARVDEIAEASGINKRMIYKYFTNKEGLYTEVLARVYTRISNSELDFLSKATTFKEAIQLYVYNSYEFLRSDPNFTRIVLYENLNQAKHLKTLPVAKYKSQAVKILRELYDEAAQNGEVNPKLDFEQIMLDIILFCFSYFANNYTLSLLFGKDYSDEVNVESRVKHIAGVADMIMGNNVTYPI